MLYVMAMGQITSLRGWYISSAYQHLCLFTTDCIH